MKGLKSAQEFSFENRTWSRIAYFQQLIVSGYTFEIAACVFATTQYHRLRTLQMDRIFENIFSERLSVISSISCGYYENSAHESDANLCFPIFKIQAVKSQQICLKNCPSRSGIQSKIITTCVSRASVSISKTYFKYRLLLKRSTSLMTTSAIA